jgi:Na+/proline symporter
MNPLKKIASINMGILLIYTLLSRLADSSGGQYKGLGFMIFMMIAIGVHVLVNIILCLFHFARKNKELGRAYLISGILVLLIGFSACLGIASLY